jgi:hypothetical protein
MNEVGIIVNLEVSLLQFAFVSVEHELDSTIKRRKIEHSKYDAISGKKD